MTMSICREYDKETLFANDEHLGSLLSVRSACKLQFLVAEKMHWFNFMLWHWSNFLNYLTSRKEDWYPFLLHRIQSIQYTLHSTTISLVQKCQLRQLRSKYYFCPDIASKYLPHEAIWRFQCTKWFLHALCLSVLKDGRICCQMYRY